MSEDYELVEAENMRLNKKVKEAIADVDFAINFIESNGVITKAILKSIKDRLVASPSKDKEDL